MDKEKLGLSQEEIKMFEEIGQVMNKHNLQRKFGLFEIHKHFEISEEEILQETNDPIKRTHTVTVKKKGEIKNSKPTMWTLE